MTVLELTRGAVAAPLALWTVLGLGFVLGLRHALDADHLVALSTIVSRSKSGKAALLVGALWGHDRLQASPNPAVATSLRFDALAAADANADGEVTLDELTAAPLDVRLYDPSGLGAVNFGAFVTALARTVGHFRGEGECTVSGL